MILIQLAFETAEQREGIGGRARESCQNLFLIKPANLLGAVFDNRLAERHLAVSGHDDAAIAADAEDGGGADSGRGFTIRRRRY